MMHTYSRLAAVAAALTLTVSGTLVAATAPALAAARQLCGHPVWSSSLPGNGEGQPGFPGTYSPGNSPYIFDNDMWNAAGYNISQTINVCADRSWYVDTTIPAGIPAAVRTYPHVAVDYRDIGTGEQPTLSAIKALTSSYSGRAAGVGVYDVAYDIWLNGIGGQNSKEVMIWTDVNGQNPPTDVSDLHISGRNWDLWATSDNSYIRFVPPGGRAYPSGKLDLKAFFDYLIRAGRIPATAKLTSIEYGVEIVSTGGQKVRFSFSHFSVRPLGARGHAARQPTNAGGS
jgi:hypothetical protein